MPENSNSVVLKLTGNPEMSTKNNLQHEGGGTIYLYFSFGIAQNSPH